MKSIDTLININTVHSIKMSSVFAKIVLELANFFYFHSILDLCMFEYVCVCALVWSKKWIIMLDRHPILFQAVKRNSTHFDEFTAKMEKLVILMTGSDSFFSCTGFSWFTSRLFFWTTLCVCMYVCLCMASWLYSTLYRQNSYQRDFCVIIIYAQ